MVFLEKGQVVFLEKGQGVFLEKRQGLFIRARVFLRINMVFSSLAFSGLTISIL